MQASRMVIGRPWRLTRMVSPSPIERTVARNSVAGTAAALSWMVLGILAAIARTSRSCGLPGVNYVGGRVDSCELLPI